MRSGLEIRVVPARARLRAGVAGRVCLRATILAFVACLAWACGQGEGGAGEESGMPPADSFAMTQDTVADGRGATPTSAGAVQARPEPAPTSVGSVPAGDRVFTYVASEFAFEGPQRIPAGVSTLRLVNRGHELHHVQIVGLQAGRSASELARSIEGPKPEASLPEWARLEGGPNAVAPGGESNATVLLKPGSYVLTCWIPSPSDGVAHVSKGMSLPVEVFPEEGGAAGTLPTPDVRVRLVDYDFQLPATIAPGTHAIAVENAGSEPHELALFHLAPGKSMGELLAWLEAGMQGQPPALPVGGVAPLSAGLRNSFSANLSPGDYALLCFVPDDEDGKLHIAHGMAKQITVEGGST